MRVSSALSAVSRISIGISIVLGSSALSSRAYAQNLKVLTLNFNSEIVAFDDRDETIRDIRFAAFTQWVAQQKPDILFFCEAWNYRGYPSVVIPLAQELGYDYFYRIAEGFPGLEFSSDAILVRKEFHMKQRHLVKLPHSAAHLGNEVDGIIPFGSISQAVGAKLTLESGEPLFIYTTHLIADAESDRKDQIAALDLAAKKDVTKNKIAWDHAHVLIAGDINAGPLTSPVQLMLAQGYEDSWKTAHPDHSLDALGATICEDPRTPCFNPFDLGAGQLPAQDTMGANNRIDYIFARGPSHKTLASTIVFTHPFEKIFMSDHYGVLSTIAFGEDSLSSTVVPNPLNDSEGLPPEAPTLVLEVSDATFQRDEVPVQVIPGNRGFAIINSSAIPLWATLEGPGQVFPSPLARLKKGKVSSFVFERSGKYHLEVFNRRGQHMRTIISVL